MPGSILDIFHWMTYMRFQYLSGHFDTKVGLKGQSSSYSQIAKTIGIEPEAILFLTDIPAGKIIHSIQ